MTSRTASVGVFCLFVLLMTACGDDATGDATGGDAESPGSVSQTSGGDGEPDYDAGLRPLVEQARADLAERLDIDPSDITLILAELREWPNSAIGCPEEGRSYAPQVNDGSEIVLSVDGAEYRYTTGGESFVPALCEND